MRKHAATDLESEAEDICLIRLTKKKEKGFATDQHV